MNHLGPLPTQLTAAVDADRSIVLFARPPGPAGLATVALAEGRVELAVDGAEPENLVRLAATDRADPLVQQVLAALLDGPTREALAAVPDGTGHVVIWQDEDGRRAAARPWDRGGAGSARGPLGRIGRLALVLGELTRADRTPFATALGLFEAATLVGSIQRDLAPVPDARQLAAAALDHLGRTRSSAWAPDLDAAALAQVVEALDRLDRSLDDLAPEAAAQLARVRQLLDGRARSRPSGGERPAASAARADLARSTAPPPRAAARAEAPAPAADAGAGPRPPGQPVALVVDESVGGLRATAAAVIDGHLVAEGTGNAVDAWMRAFVGRPAPVLVALAPVRATGVGRWTARALLPPHRGAPTLAADLTSRPAEPWRSSTSRWVATAVDLGAAAARAARAGDPSAPHLWDRSADAWAAAGDPERAEYANRLRSAAVDGARPSAQARRAADHRPLVLDLLD